MSASVWLFQDPKQVAKHGEEQAAWSVGWYDPDGKRRCKSCGPGRQGKRDAEKLADKIHSQLIAGTYKDASKKTWEEFKTEWEARIGANMLPQTRRLTFDALAHFERIINPIRVASIKTQTIDDFIARRRLEPGKRKGETIRPASINKELRHLRAVLRIADDWKYLPDLPRFRFIKEPGKLVTFVSPEHFAALYQVCEEAKRPADVPGVAPADWWRGLLVFCYMTGWRICEVLALRRSDVDLDAGWAVTRAADNKGKRDERIKLHPVVNDHLRKLTSFEPVVFPWHPNETALYKEFHRLQRVAGISIPCPHQHEHTPRCGLYGFHDLRRAFATQNAPRLTADALQKLMRHKSYLTTQKYINMASQLDEAVSALHVPEVLKAARA
jgi:integrase